MNSSLPTMNETISPFEVEPMNIKIIKAVASGIITIISIFGNILVITAVCLITRMKTFTNYLIVNMAIADLIYILVAMPPLYVQIFEIHKWLTSSYWNTFYICKIANFAQYLLITASVLTLACIAADRYVAIVFPLRKIITNKVFYVLVTGIWVTALGVGAPALYAWKPVYFEGFGYDCVEEWAKDQKTSDHISMIYTATLFSVAYCIPFVSISTMYTIVCRRVWRRKVIKTRRKKQYRKAIESRKKVVKMLITVVIAFIACWLPLQIATFLWHAGIEISSTTHFICKFLMRMHTAMSPLIYATFSENYRRGFQRTLKCCLGQRPLTSSIGGFSFRMTQSSRRSSNVKNISRDITPDDDCHGCDSVRHLHTTALIKKGKYGETISSLATNKGHHASHDGGVHDCESAIKNLHSLPLIKKTRNNRNFDETTVE